MNASYRTKLIAGAIFFCGLGAALTAEASSKVDAANLWLRGEELQLASATQIDASVEISSQDHATQKSADLEDLERDLRVHVWHGRDDDDPYSKGEQLDLSFRTNDDAYVVVYRIDTEGYVEVLWPGSRFDDGFAYGGHTYDLPPRDGGHRLRVSNVKGVEYIQTIASEYPFDLRDLAIDFAFDREETVRYDYEVAGDPFLAVNDINYAITGLEEDVDFLVTDWTHLYVESKVEYARYSCNQCHVDDDDYHAYVDTCSQVTIRYDFGWYDRWYTRYGWYPVYYDPLYVYWDSFYYRPYYNWYYPVYYRWPSYYTSIYNRPYRVYSWYDSDYYRGDYRRRYRDGYTRTRPLYPDRGGSVNGRIKDVIRGDTASRGDRTRLGDGERRRDASPSVASRIRDVRSDRRQDILRTERSARRIDRGAGIRNRTADRSRVRDRVTSLGPDGKRKDRRSAVSGDTRRGRDGRRWTRPVVRNTDRSNDSKRGLRTRDRSQDRDKDRPNLRSRARSNSRRDEDKRQPRVRSNDRKRTPRKDSKPTPREVKSRDRKGKGKSGGGDDRAARITRDSKRSQRSPRATVKRSAPRTRGGKSPAQRSSGSRSNVKSRDRSGSKGSPAKSSSSRPAKRGGGRKGSGRGGRG
jgi:hypothetical protein